jgi:hypothetical protein
MRVTSARLLHHVDKAGILVGEAVVILAPDGGRYQQVERGNLASPGEFVADRKPLRVLIEHGIDHMREGLVGRKKSVPAAEQITFEHAFDGVLAEHFDDAAIGRQFAAVAVFGKELAIQNFLLTS